MALAVLLGPLFKLGESQISQALQVSFSQEIFRFMQLRTLPSERLLLQHIEPMEDKDCMLLQQQMTSRLSVQ